MPSRGSGQFGADILVGSKEYWRLWREKNRDRMQLAQKKYRLKQRELIVAAEVAAGRSMIEGEPVSVEQALIEVTEKTKAITEYRKAQIIAGVIAPIGTSQLVVDNAQRWLISYEAAANIMEKAHYSRWEKLAKEVREGKPFVPDIEEEAPGEFSNEMLDKLKEIGVKIDDEPT